MRQPDIEIYLRDDHLDDLFNWLGREVGQLNLHAPTGLTQRGSLKTSHTTPVMVVRKAAGKWASIWFDSDQTPWETDVDCARAVHAGIGHEVRCSVGGWTESDGEADADRWLKVNSEGEAEFVWAQKP
ncbi:hypothetical protein SAMN05216421_2200 [Halopseudomonas xinjiangensis]|uniref:Uncharacterized protein n=1 Tax=Halopseudomonas xinjiangensis TaxID=487184 RepID=A0A1H1V308_9GAMM|nr:hypothetical protein [Halopseudomonas xinjiangensis]SDS79010.1 hypothetical protein SAMN05216421_2200 [Halopseudomonas xinjiangensis]